MTRPPVNRKAKAPSSRAAASNPDTRRGRPVGDHDARRTDLLAAAIAVIAREGSAGASLRKVASEAGCTTGALVYYFESKEAMLVAVVDSLFDAWELLLGEPGDALDIQGGFQRWLYPSGPDDPIRWLAGFQLLAYARAEPALAVIYQRRYAKYRHKLAKLLAQAQSTGQVRSDIPATLLADQLSAMGDGWMMMLPIEPERFKPSRLKALLDAVATLLRPATEGVKPALAKASRSASVDR